MGCPLDLCRPTPLAVLDLDLSLHTLLLEVSLAQYRPVRMVLEVVLPGLLLPASAMVLLADMVAEAMK